MSVERISRLSPGKVSGFWPSLASSRLRGSPGFRFLSEIGPVPFPGGGKDVLKARMGRNPLKELLGLLGLCHQFGGIPRPAGPLYDGDLLSRDGLGLLDDLFHRITLSGDRKSTRLNSSHLGIS